MANNYEDTVNKLMNAKPIKYGIKQRIQNMSDENKIWLTVVPAIAIAALVVNMISIDAKKDNEKYADKPTYMQELIVQDEIRKSDSTNKFNLTNEKHISVLQKSILEEYANLREVTINYSTVSKEERNKVMIEERDEYDKFKINLINYSAINQTEEDRILTAEALTILKINIMNREMTRVKGVDQNSITNENQKVESIQKRINDEKYNLGIVGPMADDERARRSSYNIEEEKGMSR